MKKILVIVLALAMVIGLLTACGGKKDTGTISSDDLIPLTSDDLCEIVSDPPAAHEKYDNGEYYSFNGEITEIDGDCVYFEFVNEDFKQMNWAVSGKVFLPEEEINNRLAEGLMFHGYGKIDRIEGVSYSTNYVNFVDAIVGTEFYRYGTLIEKEYDGYDLSWIVELKNGKEVSVLFNDDYYHDRNYERYEGQMVEFAALYYDGMFINARVIDN